MIPFLRPARMIGCALTLALGIARAPLLAVAAPPAPPAAGGDTDKPGRLSKIPGPMPTTAPTC